MKMLKNYTLKNERISIPSEEIVSLENYPYILIYEKVNKEYTLCRYNLYYEENLEIIWFIDLEDDYNWLTDEIMGLEIEIIGFLESIPYNYENLENHMYRMEYEKDLCKKLNIWRKLNYISLSYRCLHIKKGILYYMKGIYIKSYMRKNIS